MLESCIFSELESLLRDLSAQSPHLFEKEAERSWVTVIKQ